MGFVVREIQPTPNPNAMKFILDRRISENPASFFTPDQAKDHPLVSKLFAIAGVSNILLLGDFVTIGKIAGARWSDINGQVKRVLSGG